MDWTQVVAILSTIVGSAVGVTWFLATRLSQLDQRLELLHRDLRSLQGTIGVHSQVLGILAGSLQRVGGLTPEDVSSITRLVSVGVGPQTGRAIDEAARGNPITQEEAARLRSYVAKAQRGELFNNEEVEDFYSLSNRVAQEEPGEPGAWALVALGAFLLGLYIGASRRREA